MGYAEIGRHLVEPAIPGTSRAVTEAYQADFVVRTDSDSLNAAVPSAFVAVAAAAMEAFARAETCPDAENCQPALVVAPAFPLAVDPATQIGHAVVTDWPLNQPPIAASALDSGPVD